LYIHTRRRFFKFRLEKEMKKTLVLVIMSLCLISFGCKHPADYIEATDLAFEIAPKADKNVETVCLNLYNQVSKHTEELVASGKMEESERQKVLDILKEQVVTTRKQVLYLTSYIKLAHQYAHSNTLKVDDFIAILEATNEAIPEPLAHRKEVSHKPQGG